MQFRWALPLALLALAFDAVAAVEPGPNVVAAERGGLQLSIQVWYDLHTPARTAGRWQTVKGSCAGTLAFLGKTTRNELAFQETLDAGRCVPDCKLYVDFAFTRYREVCPGGRRGASGQFADVEIEPALKQRLAQLGKPAYERTGVYKAADFSGVNVWADLFDKMANDKPGFEAFLQGITRSSTGPNALAYGLVNGGQRNYMQKLLSDLQVHRLYQRDPATLLAQARQCQQPREYTAAEACDCTAGFPGDTALGPGAGELVVQSNRKLIDLACAVAADNADNPADRGRFLAQQARALILGNDQTKSLPLLEEAQGLGYRRAAIVMPVAAVIEVEVRSGGFPPPTDRQYRQLLAAFSKSLETARANGVREAPVVEEQMEQVFDRLKFNNAVLQPIYREMVKPIPRENCEPDYGVIGIGGDGKPMIGIRNPCRRDPGVPRVVR